MIASRSARVAGIVVTMSVFAAASFAALPSKRLRAVR